MTRSSRENGLVDKIGTVPGYTRLAATLMKARRGIRPAPISFTVGNVPSVMEMSEEHLEILATLKKG